MPAWWKGKGKSKSKSQSSPNLGGKARKDGDGDAAAAAAASGHGKKEKANSFDGVVAAKSRDLSPIGGGFDFGHPLPRPSSTSSPLPAVGSASASTSSVSSSGSSDETPDLGFYRYSDPISMPRGRNAMPDSRRQHRGAAEDRQSPVVEQARCSNISVSPRKEFQSNATDVCFNGALNCKTSTEPVFNPRMASPTASSRGTPFQTSPIHQRAFGMCPGSPTKRQEGSLPHPLPLPPSSPSSSSSRSLQSQWKKGKLLGRGTFGHVYLGFNSDSGQMCAIKEVKVISDDANSKESLKQLNQEITLLSQLSHPNIVQYYGSELDDDTLSVYLEYVSGGSIHKLLQEYGPFGEPVIRSYTAQILSGLAYLHGRTTVHRDIKGANILVDPSGGIKLVDFGMAKHITAFTSIRSFKGSPYWMAPEVIMNTSGYNLSVDIWSLGCTILEMATSKPPWSKFEGVAAIFKIGNSKDIPDIPDHISSEGKDFLKLCLQRDPSARPTAAKLMEHPFVRDQAAIKAAKLSMIKDGLPSSSNGSRSPVTTEFPPNRSVSPLRNRDFGMRQTAGFPLAFKTPSDLSTMRMNMSLPVSPCSSPLRQSRHANRSCLPSPPHPAFSTGAINFSPSNYMLYPMRPSSNIHDPWPDFTQLRVASPYDSPRR